MCGGLWHRREKAKTNSCPSSSDTKNYGEREVIHHDWSQVWRGPGVLLIIVKALNELQSSQTRNYKLFADTLIDMGFYPCKTNPDVWLKDCGTHYEFVCTYVDNLACVMKHTKLFFKELRRH
jgi:hypothetical protein